MQVATPPPFPPPFHLHVIAPGDRHEAIAVARDAIQQAGAWIEDAHLFSDLMACLDIELPAGVGPALADALVASRLHVEASSLEALRRLPAVEIVGTLELTFAHGEGKLRHEVPAVP